MSDPSNSGGSDSYESDKEMKTHDDILDLFASDREEKSFSGFDTVPSPVPVVDKNNNVASKIGTNNTTDNTVTSKGPGKGPGLNKKGKAKAVKRKSSENPKSGSLKKQLNYDPQVLEEILELCNMIQPQFSQRKSADHDSDAENLPSCSTGKSSHKKATSTSGSNLLSSNSGNKTSNDNFVNLNEGINIFSNEDDNNNEEVVGDEGNIVVDFPQIFTDEIQFSDPVKSSLGEFIEKCLTKQADIKTFLKDKNIKIPSNCTHLLPRRLSHEMYSDIPAPSKAGDSAIQDVQKLMGLGVVPLLTLVSMFSTNTPIDTNVAQQHLLNSITLICNAHFELSIRRRYLLKRFIKRKFHQLCVPNNPVGENLFGNELTQKMKDIGESSKLFESGNRFNTNSGRGGHGPKNGKRGPPRGPRGNRGSYRGKPRPPRRGGYHRY